MLTGVSREKALQKACSGHQVYVVDRENVDSCGNTPMIPFMNYLNGLDFIVDVPAVPDPDFEAAVQDMIDNAHRKVEEEAADEESDSSGGENIPPPEPDEVETPAKKRNGPKPKKCNVDLLTKYAKEGKSNREIAELMGMPVTTVNNWIRQYGLTGFRKRGGWRGAEKQEKLVHVEASAEKVKECTGKNTDRHKCKTCRFRGRENGCDYISIMEHSRGCSVEDCNVYEKGNPVSKRKQTGFYP